MGPIRQIFDDAPDAIPVPPELRHRRLEYILWPLDEAEEPIRARPKFNIAEVVLQRARELAPESELDAGYRAMATDSAREQEATEWGEALIGDAVHAPR